MTNSSKAPTRPSVSHTAMKTNFLKRLALGGVSAILLVSCGRDSPPADDPVVAESTPPKAEIPEPAPSANPDSERDPELEKEIDAYFAEREDLKDLQKLMTDPTMLKMMDSMMENWEPTPELEERLMKATEMLMVSKMPESPITGVLAEGNLEELEGTGENITIGTTDPEMVREMVGHVLMQDAEGFILMFCKAIEESAVTTAIDPEAKSPIFIETGPGQKSEAGEQKER